MTEYKILPELNLIIEYYSGLVETNDVINFKHKQVNDKNYNANFNIIACVSNIAIDDVNRRSARQFVDSLSSEVDFTGKRNTAIITQSPKQVVAGTLYQIELDQAPINFKIVSTLEAALDWVSLPEEHLVTIAKHIEIFKKQSEKLICNSSYSTSN